MGEAGDGRESAKKFAWGGGGGPDRAERGPCLWCKREADGELAAVEGYGEGRK